MLAAGVLVPTILEVAELLFLLKDAEALEEPAPLVANTPDPLSSRRCHLWPSQQRDGRRLSS